MSSFVKSIKPITVNNVLVHGVVRSVKFKVNAKNQTVSAHTKGRKNIVVSHIPDRGFVAHINGIRTSFFALKNPSTVFASAVRDFW